MPAFGFPSRVLGIIPARRDSKRLPGKNMMEFRGKPLSEWAMDHGSKHITQTVVTSNDDKVIALAIRKGIDAVLRPEEMCHDDSPVMEAVNHVLARYRADWVVLLQPTSPLRNVFDIDGCIEEAWRTRKPVVSTCGGKLNGAVYVATPAQLYKNGSFSIDAVHYEMPAERSVDIDTLEDFLLAVTA